MPSTPKIKLLSDQVANKIAAGEVVDRPASVMKELVENAMDAGATQLDIEVQDGGRKAVIVADNGTGMNRDDALLSIERHATSKIREVDDIEAISTLGFRGEALAAIASVSRFSLETREQDAEAGTEVIVTGGKVQDVLDAGCPPGTCIKVRHLFFNVPARRKFLRSAQTENTHLRQTFLVYALSHPTVGMSLQMDGKEVYRLPRNATLEERIRDLFGADIAKGLKRVDHHAERITVTGYVGLPHLTRGDRADQFLFINGRPSSAAMLSYALQEGYHTLVPRGRYPVVFLFMEIDPLKVDVNVHPAKKEVRFREPIAVRDAVIEAVKEALARPAEEAGLPQAASAQEDDVPGLRKFPEPRVTIDDLPETPVFNYPRIPMTPNEPPVQATFYQGAQSGEDGKGESMAPWAQCRVLGQVGGLYVVLETDEGLVLMDPHAAHERIMFETFMKQVKEDKVTGQGLLFPETIELGPRDAQVVRDQLELLVAMGFGISEFGGDTFMVDALPKVLGNVSAASVLTDVSGQMEKSGKHGGTEFWAEAQIAQAACKAAVKARDRLSRQEVEQLVIDLARAEMPYTCPHGRPTVIFMGYDELDKKFGRT